MVLSTPVPPKLYLINVLFHFKLLLDKMERFSPKIEIINHFDNLINRVDIDIDIFLEKYNDEKSLDELLTSSENNRKNFRNINDSFDVSFFSTFNPFEHQYQTLDLCTNSTKVIDYLKQVRMKTIEELRKAQEDTLEYYKLNSWRFKTQQSNERNISELRSELFSEKFYFQVHFTQADKILWAFNTFTFVTDFYMSPSDIDSLE